jgi:hypothetical protein
MITKRLAGNGHELDLRELFVAIAEASLYPLLCVCEYLALSKASPVNFCFFIYA